MRGYLTIVKDLKLLQLQRIRDKNPKMAYVQKLFLDFQTPWNGHRLIHMHPSLCHWENAQNIWYKTVFIRDRNKNGRHISLTSRLHSYFGWVQNPSETFVSLLQTNLFECQWCITQICRQTWEYFCSFNLQTLKNNKLYSFLSCDKGFKHFLRFGW